MPFLGKHAYKTRHPLLLLHSSRFSLPWPRIQSEKVNPWPGLSCVAVGDWGWFAGWWSAPIVSQAWSIVSQAWSWEVAVTQCPTAGGLKGICSGRGYRVQYGACQWRLFVIYIMLYNITAVYVHFLLWAAVLLCCPGQLETLGSRQPSCLSLQSHQDVRWGYHAWLRTVYKKALFKDTYCTHLCIYRRPTCTYCVCGVWVCMPWHLCDTGQMTDPLSSCLHPHVLELQVFATV